MITWAESVRFHFAYQQKWNPHWYCLKKEQNPEMFVRVVQHMRDYGYIGRWGGRPWLYYDIGEWYYWTMENNLEITKLINRKRLADR